MANPSRQQPNVLLVMADQMTPFMLEACGYPVAKTAHLSRLAATGVQFSTAYTASPICVPARASLMTGLHCSSIGCYDNGDPYQSFVPTFAHYLTNAGYETVLTGKMHFVGADQLHGFQRRLNTDIYPAGFIWSYPLFDEDQPDAVAFDFVQQFMAENIGPGWSTELQYDEETQFRALEYIRYAPHTPFLLVTSFTSPHPPYKVPKKYWDMYKDMDMPMPQYPSDMDARFSTFDKALMRWHGLDKRSIKSPENLLAMRRGYCALSHYVDDKVGELLAALEERGLRENTVVIFTADHGEMLGEKGLIQKRSLYDWATRVPLIVNIPGAQPGVVNTPVSLLDIMPTLLDLAGEKPTTPLHGRSLIPAIQGDALPDTPVIAEYHGEGIMRPCFMVRLGPWKYVYIHRANAQLFNLQDDPGEWNNLCGKPEVAAIEKQLRELITEGQFDLDFLEKDVADRLALKQVVNTAMALNKTAWDYRPEVNPANQYVRK